MGVMGWMTGSCLNWILLPEPVLRDEVFLRMPLHDVDEFVYAKVDCWREEKGLGGIMVCRGLGATGESGDRGMLVIGDLRGREALLVTALEMFKESFGLATRAYMTTVDPKRNKCTKRRFDWV